MFLLLDLKKILLKFEECKFELESLNKTRWQRQEKTARKKRNKTNLAKYLKMIAHNEQLISQYKTA
jgi:hypothetical protein